MTSEITYDSVRDPFNPDVQEASGAVERRSAFTWGFIKIPIHVRA
ncbi:MAG: hypothetical protein WBN70_07600 [Polyangiales bacterium]